MSSDGNLTKPDSEWVVRGIPIIGMMNMEKRSGKVKSVIQKAFFKLQMLIDKNIKIIMITIFYLQKE